MSIMNHPTDPVKLLHFYALKNLKPSPWGPVKCYPAETKIIQKLSGFPNIPGFRLTPDLSDCSQP